jgi:hypothetical protein
MIRLRIAGVEEKMGRGQGESREAESFQEIQTILNDQILL